MKIKYILVLIILIAGITSCFEDKGNYSYDEKNDITITFETSSFKAILGETVKLYPKLTFALDSNDVDLSYEWTFMGKKISDQRNLEWTVDTVIDFQSLFLNVLDKRTGVTYSGEVSAHLTTPYTADAWMILAKQNEKSVLSYIREKQEDSEPYSYSYVDVPNIYQLVNRGELGSEPVRVLEHFARTNTSGELGHFWVIQQGGQGCVDLSGNDFTKDILLNNIFLDGHMPKDFKPIDMIDMKWFTCVVNQDGKIYSRKKLTDALFNSGYFINRPLMFEGDEVDGSRMVLAPFARLNYTVMYDKVHNRFLALTDLKKETAGKVMKFAVDESEYKADYARLDNLGKMKVLHTGYYEVNENDKKQGYYSILQDPETGTYYTHDFQVLMMTATREPSASPVLQKQINLSSVIDGTSKNVFNVLRSWVYGEDFGTPYILISKDNELWLYDRVAKLPVSLYYEFPKGQIINAINSECVGSRRVAVGMESGEFYILDMTRAAVNGQKEKVVYKSKHDFGQIVHIRYKVGYGDGWSF